MTEQVVDELTTMYARYEVQGIKPTWWNICTMAFAYAHDVDAEVAAKQLSECWHPMSDVDEHLTRGTFAEWIQHMLEAAMEDDKDLTWWNVAVSAFSQAHEMDAASASEILSNCWSGSGSGSGSGPMDVEEYELQDEEDEGDVEEGEEYED